MVNDLSLTLISQVLQNGQIFLVGINKRKIEKFKVYLGYGDQYRKSFNFEKTDKLLDETVLVS